jgi:hypothetical protein
MAYQPLFRDVQMPSRDQDRRAHEAFLLDTHMERRAQERPRLADRIRAVLRSGGR